MPLTKKDLEQIEAMFEKNNEILFRTMFSYIDLKFVEQNKALDERLNLIPTKDEYFTKADEQVTELKALREEVEISNARSAENRKRIERIESKLSITY